MYNDFIYFVKALYKTDQPVPLHAPCFKGNEKKYVLDTIDSTFVSSVGAYVDGFEKKFAEFIGANYAIATVNGTAALHIALLLAGVQANDEVITQPFTFVATCNAIAYSQAFPVFVDIDLNTLGLSAEKLQTFFEEHTVQQNGRCINRETKRVVRACVPMHTFGHPAEIDKIAKVCHEHHVVLVEDAAESIGSYYDNKHTGIFGKLGIFSFNGNKIITTGGGGMIVTNDENLAKKAKHITTTAKQAHPYEYVHNELGFNYRMPNINAALGVAQLEQLPGLLEMKRQLAKQYETFFDDKEDIQFLQEPQKSKSNYWLNALILKDKNARDVFLKRTNEAGVMTRPAWELMNRLPMYQACCTASDSNAIYVSERLVNIPSGVPYA